MVVASMDRRPAALLVAAALAAAAMGAFCYWAVRFTDLTGGEARSGWLAVLFPWAALILMAVPSSRRHGFTLAVSALGVAMAQAGFLLLLTAAGVFWLPLVPLAGAAVLSARRWRTPVSAGTGWPAPSSDPAVAVLHR